jgi:hypothetical protein
MSQGLLRAVEIQRHEPPAGWALAINSLAPEDQDEAREYLRGIWQRMRAAQNYRSTDPDTSRQAAEMVTAIGARADHVGRIIRAVRVHPGRTSAELAQLTGLERHEAARRTADAEHQGSIHKGAPRVCSVGGRSAVTWWPTPNDAQRECLRGAA